MTLPDLYDALEGSGITLAIRLVVDAPVGSMTPEIKDALSAHKPAIMARLANDLRWQHVQGLRWGPAVNDPDPGLVVDHGGAP